MTTTPSTARVVPDGTVRQLSELTCAQVADIIGVPLGRWPGNCFGIAVALVDAGLVPNGSRAVYGHWTGPIAATSLFSDRRTLGFTGHGWVLTPDEQIIDPTRWVFEDTDPYLYLGATGEDDNEDVCRGCEHLADEHEDLFGGRCTGGDQAGYDCGPCLFDPTIDPRTRQERREYDEGGNRLRAATLRPFPAPEATEDAVHTPPTLVAALLSRHGYRSGPLTGAQLLWLANLPLELFDGAAHDAYTWLTDVGFAALIPWDNRTRVLG